EGAHCKQLVLAMIDQEIDRHLDQCLARDYGTETFAKWSSKEFGVEFDARDFRGMDFNDAQLYALDQAERKVEGQVLDAIDENLPDDVDTREWNWEALAKMANGRWNLSLRDRDVKQVGREGASEFLLEKARVAIRKVDLGAGRVFLEPDYGLQAACAWVKYKFGIDLPLDEVRDLAPEAFKEIIRQRAAAAYHEKEAEYPVMAGLYHFTTRDPSGHKRYDREELVAWARQRFHVDLDLDDLRNKQRDEIRALLIEQSRRHADCITQALDACQARLEQLGNGQPLSTQLLRDAADDGRLQALSDWLSQEFQYPLPVEKMARMKPEVLKNHLTAAVEGKFRPEMQKMERSLVLQLLDSAWKDHLLVMDHLRSSVSLRGYAQVDPKVEYKREGMRAFEQMWESIGERVTDLIFRMEQLDEGFVGSTWTGAEAVHREAPAASEIAQQQQAAIDGTQTDHKPEPIRNRQLKVGRNDPCPCGSGKKFKKCHGSRA
ncbi:MAG: SEC-C metal-binding domain-containing protein, partial [Thermoguttaceae bacterium]